ncbi:MAG TPA: hypothetical protein DCZ69_08120, partial [Syntrophobacteraceae bacterium]|nr:hypothetical protein [Syntrophobacteraceae bacterium]
SPDFRSDMGALGQILVPASDGKRQIPLSQRATIAPVHGASMIRNENGLLTGYVYVDVADRDPGSYVKEASVVLRNELKLPPGYAI